MTSKEAAAQAIARRLATFDRDALARELTDDEHGQLAAAAIAVWLVDDEPICEACGKRVLRGQFINYYDDVGEVHVNCDKPNATTDVAIIDPKAGPVYVLLGTPLTLFRAAALSTMPAQGWRDIESAPQDETAILITRPTKYESEERWHVVRWDDEQWQVHDGKFDHPLRGADPTHWQPLPAPPTNEQEG